MSKLPSVFVHVVTYNHAQYVEQAIEAALSQDGFEAGTNLTVRVTDNGSTDGTIAVLNKFSERSGVIIQLNGANTGFAAAHNAALFIFQKNKFDFYLCLNPDLRLERDALLKLIASISESPEFGSACPKLLRADSNLNPILPRTIDAAGMVLTSSLRHFDRGGDQPDGEVFSRSSEVFGGSGACLLMKKEYVESVAIAQPAYHRVLETIYPGMQELPKERLELFDEAFFAYREDADLAWRSQLFGWRCLYVAGATGYHVRRVTPERRSNLPQEINLLGVKNRFLLQINNYAFAYGLKTFLLGYCIRNLAVIAAVLLKERRSLPAFSQLLKLLKRALERRRMLKSRIKAPHSYVARWIDREEMDAGPAV